MHLFQRILLASSALAFTLQAAHAGDSGDTPDFSKFAALLGATEVKNTGFDLSVPDSPAFTALGLSANSAVNPATPRDLGTALLNGLDEKGNLQTGLAIDTRLFMLFAGSHYTLGEYLALSSTDTLFQDGKIKQKWSEDPSKVAIRILSRTQLSVASAKGSSEDDKSIKASVGLKITPVDYGDPRLDIAYLNCVSKIALNALEASPVARALEDALAAQQTLNGDYQDIKAVLKNMKDNGGSPEAIVKKEKEFTDKKKELDATKMLVERLEGEDKAAYAKALEPGLKECRTNESFRSNAWNKTAWSVGVAQTFTSTTGDINKLKGSGVAVWSTFGYGFDGIPLLEKTAQLIAHVQYRTNEQVAIDGMKGQFFRQDRLTAGGRFRIGSPDFNVSVESDYVHADRSMSARPDEKYFQHTVGADYKISDDVWLNASLGKTSGKKTEKEDTRVVATFKWAIGGKPVFGH